MPRVAPAERARKETAFEALEVTLKAAGRNNRPNENQRGYPAVTQAIVWWKDVADWDTLSADEQRLSLVSHSNWRTYRRKRGEVCKWGPGTWCHPPSRLARLSMATG